MNSVDAAALPYIHLSHGSLFQKKVMLENEGRISLGSGMLETHEPNLFQFC